MSKSTFSTRQELKSLEFGMLLHNLVQKGVYIKPTITVSSSTGEISVSGGVFLFYDTDESKSYAVRVENISKSTASLGEGQYLFLTFTYSSAAPAEPELLISNSIDSSPTKIRLGRMVRTGSAQYALGFDDTSMEMCGAGYGIDNGIINYLVYSASEQNTPYLAAAFNGKVIKNSGIISIPSVSSASFAGLDKTKAQYLYIDSEGRMKCADATVPRFGKLVIAEKPANGNFELNRFPLRAEIKGGNIEIDKPSGLATEEEAIYEQAKQLTQSDLSTSADVISLAALLKKAVDHIGNLERLVANLTQRLEYLEGVRTYFASQVTIPTAEQLVTTPTASKVEINNVETKSSGEVNIKGAVTVDSNTSSFGTSTNPIHNLYVTSTLYTDQLFVTE